MSPIVLGWLLLGVALSAAAQVALKVAMMKPAIQEHVAGTGIGSPLALAGEMLSTPMLYAGLGLYGLAAGVWLYVLSKVDVSLAYPFVGLGIVLTTLCGHFLLGENVTAMRLIGCLVVAGGLVLVARS